MKRSQGHQRGGEESGWLIGPSELHRNSPQGLNISSTRVFDIHDIMQCNVVYLCVFYLVVVEWLACLNGPESYAGGSIAARRVTHVGQVKGDKPDKKVPWSKE